MARGAVILTINRCGYVALERAAWLSGLNNTKDLTVLLTYYRTPDTTTALPAPDCAANRRHWLHVPAKVDHGQFMETKREKGLSAAPSVLPGVIYGILRNELPLAPARLAG